MPPTQRKEDTNCEEERRNNESNHWILILSRIAVLGDSSTALFASFALFGAALAVSWNLSTTQTNNPEKDPYERLGPVPIIGDPVIHSVSNGVPFLTDDMKASYERDGVLAVRGLIPDDLLEGLDQDSAFFVQSQNERNVGKPKRPGTQFHAVEHGALFRTFNNTPADEEGRSDTVSSFFKVAVMSNVPKVAAELLGLSTDLSEGSDNMRVLRDIFLSKDNDPYVCGWHVDDLGFWPATPEVPGVNAWIALDDMPPTAGGGFALAVGSHVAPWKEEAYLATGASMNFPAEGYHNATDMFSRRSGSGTCNIKTAARHLHRRMEETKRLYEIKRGDVIFHTRWLFHRTIQFDRSSEYSRRVLRRYSVRYNPGSAIIPKGYGIEPSVLWDDSNGGKSADDVCRKDGPWYPQAWPSALDSELQELPKFAAEKLSVAEARRTERKKDMQPYLKQIARKGTLPNDPIKPMIDEHKLSY